VKRCVLQKPGLIIVEDDAPDPRPGPGDIVLEVRAALTCGTDLKAWRRGHPKMPCPTPFGHEFAGRVVQLGSAVEGFALDDELMSANTGPCNNCRYCRRGQQNLCESLMDEMILGAYSQYLLITERVLRSNVYHRPDHLPFEHAALLEPLSTVCHGMSGVPLRDRDESATVLLLGAGPIALLWLVALKRAGAGRVVVAGRRPFRLEVARRLGADAVLGEDDDLEASVAQLTGGRGADLVVECTGSIDVWEQAPQLAARGGSVVLFGGCPAGSRVSLDSYRLHYDGVAIASPFHFCPADVEVAAGLLGDPSVDWSPFITSTASLDELPAVFEDLGTGQQVKCAVLPHGPGSS